MYRTCSTHWTEEKCIQLSRREKQKERDNQEVLGLDGKIILQRILKKWNRKECAELIWLMIGTSDGLLLTRLWTFGFYITYWELFEGLSSVELVVCCKSCRYNEKRNMYPCLYWRNISLRCHSEETDSINKKLRFNANFFVAKLWALSIAVPVTSRRRGVALTSGVSYLRYAGAPAEHGALSLRGGRHLLPQETIR
jgi:hypothetical protein